MWVNATLDPITAFDHHTVMIGIHKLIIEEGLPDGMHQLAPAMGENFFALCTPFLMEIPSHIIEIVWELFKSGSE